MINIRLVIAEKPSQAEKLAAPFPHEKKKGYFEIKPCEDFPDGGIITFAIGHLLELQEAKDYNPEYAEWKLEHLPIIPEKFYRRVVSSKRQQFELIHSFIKDPRITEIINAADPAREGQFLVDEILAISPKKTTYRLWSTSLTNESVKKAFRSMKLNKEYKNLTYEAMARQESDWLLGINASRCVTVLMKEKGWNDTFSVGRCQTALLDIIYQREQEIANFRAQPFWNVVGTFRFENGDIRAKWFSPNFSPETHIWNSSDAKELADYIKGKKVEIVEVTKTEEHKRPPLFYNLTSLQEEANKKYGYAPSKVLDIVQGLYEKGLLTYPRTNSVVVTKEEANWFPDTLKFLEKMQGYTDYFPVSRPYLHEDTRYVDESKVDDHYAIVLTEEAPRLATLNQAERHIYDMVARTMIAAHHEDAIFEKTEAVFLVDGLFTFRVIGKTLKREGWLKVYKEDLQKDEQEESTEDLSNIELCKGMAGIVQEVELKEGRTVPPKRFTQGNLVKVMENVSLYLSKEEKADFTKDELSLGTAATRASIINTLIQRGYIKIEKNKVFMTEKGSTLIQILQDVKELTSPLLTGLMERKLAEIGKGKRSYKEFMEEAKNDTRVIIEKLKSSSNSWEVNPPVQQAKIILGKCPVCGSDVIDRGTFYGCSGFHENGCKFSLPKVKWGRELPITALQQLLETGMSSLLVGLKGKRGTFNAYLRWNMDQQKIELKFQNDKS